MTAPVHATPLERMLDAVAHLTMVASAVRDGTFKTDQSVPAADREGPTDALLAAADACEEARKVVDADRPRGIRSDDAFWSGVRHAAYIVGQTETPPSHPGVALAIANFRNVLQRDLEGRAARRETSESRAIRPGVSK